MTCRDFFTENAENSDRCKLLQQLPMEVILSFESESASEHSPGPVADDEHLWRQIINPTHFDAAANQLKVTAFSDVSDKGGSVNRGYADYDMLYAAAQERIAELNRKKPEMNAELVGLVRLECAAVRSITTDINSPGLPIRGFIVVDTALEGNESHADICQILSQRAQSRSVRSKLVDLANEYLQNRLLPGNAAV